MSSSQGRSQREGKSGRGRLGRKRYGREDSLNESIFRKVELVSSLATSLGGASPESSPPVTDGFSESSSGLSCRILEALCGGLQGGERVVWRWIRDWPRGDDGTKKRFPRGEAAEGVRASGTFLWRDPPPVSSPKRQNARTPERQKSAETLGEGCESAACSQCSEPARRPNSPLLCSPRQHEPSRE